MKVYMTSGEEPSHEGPSKNKGKGKRKAENSADDSRRQPRELRFTSFSELNETLEQIYQDTRGEIPYRVPTRRDPTDKE